MYDCEICGIGPGCLCTVRECAAYYSPASKEQVIDRLYKGLYKNHRDNMKKYLKDTFGVTFIDYSELVEPEPCEDDEELDFVQEHKKLPIILETRDKAHWIEVGREEGALGIQYKRLRCPTCGWESSLPIPRNFCPECGTDMKGEQK